ANDRLGYDDARFHGAGRLMVEWTRALLRRGVSVTPVILRQPGSLGAAVEAEGLPFLFLNRHPYDPGTLVDFLRSLGITGSRCCTSKGLVRRSSVAWPRDCCGCRSSFTSMQITGSSPRPTRPWSSYATTRWQAT